MWGRDDLSFRVEEAEARRRGVPSAEVHILYAGHFVLDEQPEVVARLTRRFLLSANDKAAPTESEGSMSHCADIGVRRCFVAFP
jgi:hypothetical protein